ncbi:aldo/keto reductase [Propionibacterium australiense]|uniref:Aldo/keto reductase family oxidoreductase n=1 Tax=Propionibacterium australiense TaxID=119981 RepID=A0A383S6G2_9ACTN|nr:aldo/keto reductase [Propionibacterium australiense]RLP09661.1 aldo/keto reductase family oxidoreductase [Propionibacterium australiense]RLP12363.1 aldo/keto reductase family oxidoreductase [Propionibacterium australiense]SYZ33568.1 NADP-dependent oxidoreductase domain [Propionibacterium australiense]VEH89557.1 Oxidoreductase YdhF [Propionibacterium australiense]
MRTVPFGNTGTMVPNVISGMMRIADDTDEQIRALYAVARESGIDFFDHADLYGFDHPDGIHLCERRFAQALRLSPSEREQITLQTKTGIVADPWGYDQSYEHIVGSVEESLRALATDYLDVLLLHRPDALVEPEEVARAFDHLESSGKVRAFGVSNHTPRQIDLLRTAVTQPISVNQVQLSVAHASIITQGLAANMTTTDDAITRDGGGIVEYARINRITLQAWSPFQKTTRDGVFLGAPDHPELNAELDRLAARYGVTPMAIATAWITRHPAGIQVILGTTTPRRVTDAAAGSDIPLTRGEWYGLIRAAGHEVP